MLAHRSRRQRSERLWFSQSYAAQAQEACEEEGCPRIEDCVGFGVHVPLEDPSEDDWAKYVGADCRGDSPCSEELACLAGFLQECECKRGHRGAAPCSERGGGTGDDEDGGTSEEGEDDVGYNVYEEGYACQLQIKVRVVQ